MQDFPTGMSPQKKNNQGKIANPKAAALQGLEKMKYLNDLGLSQGILPPQARPNISYLKVWFHWSQ